MFQYPNQNDVLRRNIEAEEMTANIGKMITWVIPDLKGFPAAERKGIILDAQYPDYIVSPFRAKRKKIAVCKDNVISIK